MSETVTITSKAKPRYLMADSTTIVPGTIGIDGSLIMREDGNIELYVGGYYPTLVSPSSFLIDVTPLIEFCKNHGIGIYKTLEFSMGLERYKNIYEILIELEERKLISEARKEMPILFETITGQSCYINSLCTRRSIPLIRDVTQLVPEKVVRVTFADDTSEKAVCREPDKFSLEIGISICIAKKMMGGSAVYNKAVKQGVKIYEEKLDRQKSEAEEKERIQKKKEKRNAYKAKRAARRKAEQILKDEAEKERQIEIQKEAYIQAMEYMNKKNEKNEKNKENENSKSKGE